MPDSLNFKYTLTEADFVLTLRANMRRSNFWRVVWIFLVTFPVFVMFNIISGIAAEGWSFGLVFMLIWVTVLPAALAWWAWMIHPKMAAHGSPFLGEEVAGEASADGIISRSRLGKQEAAWDAYASILESSDHFLLFLGRNVFNPFPKRGFINPTDVDRFRDLVRAHVPKFRTRTKERASGNRR